MLGQVRFGQVTALCAAILVASGCSGDRLRPAGADVRIEPGVLEFPATIVGKTSSVAVRVVNSGRATMTLRLASEEPFASSVSTLVAPAGGESSVEVDFAPKQVGTFEAELRIEGDDGEFTKSVSLVGEAQLQSGCRLNDDGVACSAPCLSEGTCRQGVCVGVSPSCDDQNACTADGCGQDGTCLHVDLSASCPAPADPCQVPTCDPLTGCGSAPVVDGTACGPNDCVNAQVCVAGECRTAPAPDGSACGTATLCQAAGTCQRHACVLPRPGPVVAWSIPEPAAIGPVADAADNVYWIRVVHLDAYRWSEELVSVDRDGAERFRIPMDDHYRHLTIVHGVLITDGAPGVVDSRLLSDGQLIWSLDLHAQVANEFPAGVGFELSRPANAWVYGIDESRGVTARWAHQASSSLFALQPVLAENGTAVGVWDQIEYETPSGDWRFGVFHRDSTFEACNLPTAGEERWPASPVLLDGRLILASSKRVFALDAPGLREATHGWTGARGGRYRNSRYR